MIIECHGPCDLVAVATTEPAEAMALAVTP
jgi:hypothetical protein